MTEVWEGIAGQARNDGVGGIAGQARNDGVGGIAGQARNDVDDEIKE